MTTLTIAYSLAWLAATLYVGWLGAQHKRLKRRIDELTAAPPQSVQTQRRAA